MGECAERRRAEAESEGLLAEIQTQAHRLQATIDVVPEGMLLLDTDGRVILANPIAEAFLGILAELSADSAHPQLLRLDDRPLGEFLAGQFVPFLSYTHSTAASAPPFLFVCRIRP
jgi:PAS domain-containing protein